MPGAHFELRSTQFRREREPSWRELEELLDRVERSGLDSLTHDELTQMALLYRSVVGSLSVAGTISLDRNLSQYLTSLAQRAHLVVYTSRQQPLPAVAEFFARRFPRLLHTFRLSLAVALVSLVLGVVVGHRLTAQDSDRYHDFVSAAMAQDRSPASTTASLRSVLHAAPERRTALDVFASFLFTHNARVGLLCLALGFAAGVPVVLLLFSNGLQLGAMSALYASRGLGWEFWAWILPHGVTELLAALLCGAAGLVFGACVLFPGPLGRLDALRTRGRSASLLVLGAVPMFFIAALFESFFRSLVHDPGVRWTVALLVAAGWVFYFRTGWRRA